VNANTDNTFVDVYFQVPSELLESVINAMAPFTSGSSEQRRCHLLSWTRQDPPRGPKAIKSFTGITKVEMNMLLREDEAES